MTEVQLQICNLLNFTSHTSKGIQIDGHESAADQVTEVFGGGPINGGWQTTITRPMESWASSGSWVLSLKYIPHTTLLQRAKVNAGACENKSSPSMFAQLNCWRDERWRHFLFLTRRAASGLQIAYTQHRSLSHYYTGGAHWERNKRDPCWCLLFMTDAQSKCASSTWRHTHTHGLQTRWEFECLRTGPRRPIG